MLHSREAACMTPSAIVKYLDQYVIGQDEAKKILSVAVYSHYRKVGQAKRDAVELAKSNVLLVGPTGTGKTLTCETLARALQVPFVTADATSLAQTEFVNEEIDALLQRLLEKAGGEAERAQRGIVFIDEVDKLKAISGQARGASGESVQHALLKIMEGAPVRLKHGQYIDTTNILFICGGAFVGLGNILARTHAFGFISATGGEDPRILERLNARVKPTDLFEFGLIPEFAGRLPIIASFRDLDKEMLVRIMTVPRNAIYRQFREILQGEGVELAIGEEVFEQIAELAIEYKVGARSLRGIFEEMLTPVLYVVPDDKRIARVEIASLFEPPRYRDAQGAPLQAG
ncbi:ATP-dependent protease ATP-binding subunit ClpX [Candidatus Desulfobacillus denitrificans]|jgi:ATP-dependent Clp protease ATP-binding subunit ClpX|uniref:ATP-dependent protease ATP-binding subunit ClpX n=1 Tax=Candidatus Desulfobacillus denitrificans TaxID=2608985 RepID=A0A809QZ44_9PROT|nr:ATP-dependent Clp protease ATP-binding subunit ClpX [Rhodocyclaceae bacterium]OQY73493.1 MAG: ATP-dependent protease ATP-binding subunit ClpX [Rhodocyclaceae bacterium UTPRO2]BBO20690.1 ATP-dependent protease ATP-binding subunit ClpX [Candidatus Desulfobacillus denitrificans]